jgi:hypothetical protein
MSAKIIDASGRFPGPPRFRVVAALQPIESAKATGYETLILAPDVSIGELMHALRASDIVLSTVGPFQILKRRPPSPGAA